MELYKFAIPEESICNKTKFKYKKEEILNLIDLIEKYKITRMKGSIH